MEEKKKNNNIVLSWHNAQMTPTSCLALKNNNLSLRFILDLILTWPLKISPILELVYSSWTCLQPKHDFIDPMRDIPVPATVINKIQHTQIKYKINKSIIFLVH